MQYVDYSRQHRVTSIHRPKRGAKIFWLIFTIIILGGLGLAVYGFTKVTKESPTTIYSQIVHPRVLKSTDGRTNILLLGIDTRPKDNTFQSGTLTDTILTISASFPEKNVVLTSIPRDLYIPSAGTKINSIYNNNGNSVVATQKEVENILGLSIHYYVLIDFEGFTKVIDTLGGVDVTVPDTFDDYDYPIEGMEEATCGLDATAQTEDALASGEDPAFRFRCRFEHLHFDQGLNHLTGIQALKFARSRHALGPMGSDFGRARRQQLVIEAARNKILSSQTLFNINKLQSLYKNFVDYVQTNIDVTDLPAFYSAVNTLSSVKPQNLVLSNDASQGDGGDILVADVATDGQWILKPASGDYLEIQKLLQSKFDASPSALPSN